MIPEKIELANLFVGLSLAIDLAEGKRIQHAHGVTYIACRLGEAIGLSEYEMEPLFYAGLLHGITLISKKNLYPVCEAIDECDGVCLSAPLYNADLVIQLAQESWDGRGPKGLCGSSIPLLSRILALSIGIAECNSVRREYYLWREAVKDNISKYKSTYYDPELVSAFIGILSDHKFSLNLLNPNSSEKLNPYRPSACISGRGETITLLGKAFASFIDQKTHYTANHSKDVAEISKKIARMMGMDVNAQMDLYLAGLLHDLGKIAISNEILEKEGPLTDKEFATIKNHPYYTAVILDRIPELRQLGEIASLHHEKINGDGYYLGISGEAIPLESRIIAVADIYSALAVDRPYRMAINRLAIKDVMFNMLKEKHIDQAVVEALFAVV